MLMLQSVSDAETEASEADAEDNIVTTEEEESLDEYEEELSGMFRLFCISKFVHLYFLKLEVCIIYNFGAMME